MSNENGIDCVVCFEFVSTSVIENNKCNFCGAELPRYIPVRSIEEDNEFHTALYNGDFNDM